MNDQNLANAPTSGEWRHMDTPVDGPEAPTMRVPSELELEVQKAADRLANDQTHIAALQKEMEKLRSGRRWIPVTDDLPEQMMKLFPSADIMRAPRIAGAVLCFCKDGTKNVMRYDFNANAWVLRILNRVFYFDQIFVTHWMPLPEAPEVE